MSLPAMAIRAVPISTQSGWALLGEGFTEGVESSQLYSSNDVVDSNEIQCFDQQRRRPSINHNHLRAIRPICFHQTTGRAGDGSE